MVSKRRPSCDHSSAEEATPSALASAGGPVGPSMALATPIGCVEAMPVPFRCQVLLEKGWADMGAAENTVVCKKLVKGEMKFTTKARGQTYSLDFTGIDGPKQTNNKTNKVRRIRVLDTEETE